MSKTLDQFQAQRDVVLRDGAAKLPSGDRDALLQQAILQRYSKDRPRELVSDQTGDGSGLLAMPQTTANPPEVFEDGFSVILRIEFPIGLFPPSYLLDEDWQLYRSPTALKIMVTGSAPSVSDSVRVGWTARHKSDGSTVPDVDFEAVCDWAAALCYEALAGIYAQTGDATIMADSVNYRTKSQEYIGLAKTAAKRYFNHIGISADDKGAEVEAAIATGSIHEVLGVGLDRLTHRKASR
jgi:hypothetical protein